MKWSLILLTAFCVQAFALGENHIAADRRIAWNQAGVKGGIQSRTTSCANLTTANTLAQINAAIAACPAGQVVNFAAGTYNIAGALLVSGKSNITLRGAGPHQTIFVGTGTNSCGGLGAGILCVRATTLNDVDSPGNTTNWTAGYSKGTSTITLASTTNLQVGAILMLDQINDSTTDNGAVWMNMVAGTSCYDCASPGRGSGATERSQVQATRVTAINGTSVTIDPPVIWPNFTSSGGKDPEAWYASGVALTGVGIEDMAFNTENTTGGASIFVYNTTDSWFKNIRIDHCMEKCIWMYQSVGITVRDSYFYDKKGADSTQEGSESYGTDAYLSSMWRVENNIFHHITSAMQCESGVGGVEAYNYVFDGFYNETNPDWFQGASYTHGACAYLMREGNITQGYIQDVVHAPNYFHTALRNRYYGWQLDNFGNGQTLQTVAVHIYAPNRYNNILGNVLGTTTYHTKYESYPGSATDCDTSVFAIGFGGNCGNGTVANKTDVRTSLFRWGNYDTVNAAVRWVSGEVPTGDSNYPNTEPSSQTVPNSLIYNSKPPYWGTSIPWPPIGPDVSSGNLSNSGGKANKIPAMVCYEAASKVANTPKTGRSEQITSTGFNAASCYAGYAQRAPVNVR